MVECLHSLVPQSGCIVYVDSGSTDSSCEEARRLGANVVDLDMSLPFTAARARNAGLKRVLYRTPNSDAVMFVDGDCVIADGFLNAGVSKLAEVVGLERTHLYRKLRSLGIANKEIN